MNANFVYLIPKIIESRYAGPLMCAGTTVFEALAISDTTPRDRVGIVGLGGLGHLAVMFAEAMGCKVSVISNSTTKKDDALQTGC